MGIDDLYTLYVYKYCIEYMYWNVYIFLYNYNAKCITDILVQ